MKQGNRERRQVHARDRVLDVFAKILPAIEYRVAVFEGLNRLSRGLISLGEPVVDLPSAPDKR
jgi:hypothetical protein